MRMQDIINMGKEYLAKGSVFFLVAILVFLICYVGIYKKLCKGEKELNWKKTIWWIIFLLYLFVVISVTMFSRGRFWEGGIVSFFYSYREAWISASAASWRNIILNILLFVPFGFWLPVGKERFRVFWKTYLAGFLFTLVIETLQFILSYGIFEVADLFNNTLGAMIGFGCYEIVYQIVLLCKKKKKSVKKLILLQLPLIFTVGMFTSIYLVYKYQELGNLPIECILPYDEENLTITSDELYKQDSDEAMVYKAKILSVEETEKMAKDFFARMGTKIDESRTDIYDETVFYWSKDRYNMSVEFTGGSYNVADFDTLFPNGDVETATEVKNASEQKIRDALKVYGIELPEEALFSNHTEDGRYKFELDQFVVQDKMYDGFLSCTYYDNGKIGEIWNNILEFESYKQFEIISEQEAYEQILNGKFSENVKTDSEIEVGEVSLEYMLDSKGFYQPVYIFDVCIDGAYSKMQIPAVK